MERNLFKYIWRYSKKDQGSILLMVALSLPFYFMSLELPKQIVNTGIQGQGFDGPGSTQDFFGISLPVVGELFGGIALEQTGALLGLSFAFLALVFVNGLFKFVINTSKGRLGERMLRRLRFELADRLLRFSYRQIRRMKGPEVATMVKDEVEPLGGFIGDAFVTPAFLGGQAITAMAFILVQSMWLGVIAGGIVLLQAVLIPYLRKRILVLGRERQLTARQLAGRIGEVMEGTPEIHTNDASHWERAELSHRLGRIFWIRFEIYQRKFFVKFLNNFLSQVTPFIFYALGGYLAINGHLDIGALVAVIAAYKDLPGPVRDLINWEQQRADVQIKYEQVIDQFQPTDIMDPAQQPATADTAPRLTGTISFANASLTDEEDSKLIDGITVDLDIPLRVGVVGEAASGKDHLVQMLAGLTPPTSGHLKVAGQEIEIMPESQRGRRMGFVGQTAYLFSGSVRDNLVYGLRHFPLRPADYDEEGEREHAKRVAEAKRSANCPLDTMADWIDYEAAGAAGEAGLIAHLLKCIEIVGLEDDIYRFGLFGKIDPERRHDIAESILSARKAVKEHLETEGLSDLVVHFARERYNLNATIAENLLFGTPIKESYRADSLASNELFRGLLKELDLEQAFAERGLKMAQFFVEIFADLPAGHPFFEQFSFISADDLPLYDTLVQRAGKGGIDGLTDEERTRLVALPLSYVEARHRLDLVDEDFAERIVAGRAVAAERIEEHDPGAVAFYDRDKYNAAASLLDNILYGRLVYGQAQAQETVERIVAEVLSELDLRDEVMQVGLDHDVGVRGQRLTATQRQKLGIARALAKKPDLLLLNEATGVMDGATRARVIAAVLAAAKNNGSGLFWVLERASLGEQFDYLLVIKNGRLAEQGTFEELSKEGTVLHDLLSSD